MSSPPSKSQSNGPLHNFSFAEPKWSNSHHRGRRLGEPSPPQAAAPNAARVRRPASGAEQSPSSNAAVVRPPAFDAAQKPPSLRVLVGGKPCSAPENADRAFSSFNSERVAENTPAPKELGEKHLSNRLTRLRIKNKPVEVPQEQEDEEEDRKTWNLRPRKPRGKTSTFHPKTGDTEAALPPAAEDVGGSKDSPKELKWPKFSLTLTPQEIEEDIFAMTGSRPSRKPSRRPKAVQEELDKVFPGMWLESVTPDSYKVPEASKKKKK